MNLPTSVEERVNSVTIVRVANGVDEAMRRGLDLTRPMIEPGSKVVIKPNLCCLSHSGSGATTDPLIVQALLAKLTSEGCEISIVESDNFERSADEAFSQLGYLELARRYSAKLVNLSKAASSRVTIGGSVIESMRVADVLLEANHIVSVAKLKTCVNERMTGILKNQMGLVSGRIKRGLHPFMSEILSDLYSVFRPSLSIIDAIIGMEGRGPTDGFPRKVGALIMGLDGVAVDAVAAQMMGFSPMSIPHLRHARRRGLGEIDPGKIRILGDGMSALVKPFQFIPMASYSCVRLGLKFQKIGRYIENLGDLAYTVGDALAAFGYQPLAEKLTLSERIDLSKRWIFKLNL
jgi:uncharacterized protein (DUF362 family)